MTLLIFLHFFNNPNDWFQFEKGFAKQDIHFSIIVIGLNKSCYY